MKKNTRRGLLGRMGTCVLMAAILITMMPSVALAAVSSKNTTAITPVVNGTTVVSSPTEFQRAAADVKVSVITLGADIVFPDFQYFERKTLSDLTINGAGLYSISVPKSAYEICHLTPTGHVSLEFKGYKNLTFTDIVLSGEAFNAFVYSHDALNLTFHNVNFSGPALAYVKACLSTKGYAKVTLSDSDITLRSRVPDSKDCGKTLHLYPSEAVRIGYGDIVLDGNVTINKIFPSVIDLDNKPVFRFQEKFGDLNVASDAVVNINNGSTAAKSCHRSGLVKTYCLPHNNFIVGAYAEFNYFGDGGTIVEGEEFELFEAKIGSKVNLNVSIPQDSIKRTHKLHEKSYFCATSIIVNKNAEVNIISKYDALYANEAVVETKNLTVLENAAFRVIAPDNNTAEYVLRIEGKKPVMYLDRPDDVLFYNGNKLPGKKSPTTAIDISGCLADTDFTFIGAGISAWKAVDNPIAIDMSTYTVDPAKALTWSTGRRAFTFTFKAIINKKDLSLTKQIVNDPNGYLTLATHPMNPVTGLKTFGDKSIIQFNGASAPKLTKLNITHKFIFGEWDIVPPPWFVYETLEGNGIETLEYVFDPDMYRSTTPYQNFIFNLYDNPPTHPRRILNLAKVVGTYEKLPPGATLVLNPATGLYTLSVSPTNGLYPEVDIYFALKTTDSYYWPYPTVVYDPVNPDYWYTGDL